MHRRFDLLNIWVFLRKFHFSPYLQGCKWTSLDFWQEQIKTKRLLFCSKIDFCPPRDQGFTVSASSHFSSGSKLSKCHVQVVKIKTKLTVCNLLRNQITSVSGPSWPFCFIFSVELSTSNIFKFRTKWPVTKRLAGVYEFHLLTCL